ncbi:MAG: efflux RND transporter periplasmic adaptor subunit [Bacteroidia bacterium]|nr:efflux RND transporter periplasmic adaptor subunit [Bacteroidia bacterium]
MDELVQSPGMDRVIKKRKWTPEKIGLYIVAPLLGIIFIGWLISSTSGSRLKVQKERLSIATVEKGIFQETIPITGRVLPLNTVRVDAVEGGQVKEVYLEGGEIVEKGDIILKLTNPGLELNYMNLTTNMLEQADQLRNTRITMENTGLNLKDDLIQIDYRIRDLGEQHKRNEVLFKDSVISRQVYETTKFEYEYQIGRRQLMMERIRRDSILRGQQIGQVETSLDLVDQNLYAIKRNLDNLIIKAPVSGQLSAIRVDIGQTVNQGDNLGQIDILDGYKVRANIDEHYVSRIEDGQKGSFPFAGDNHLLIIRKIYTTVANGSFEVDMNFINDEPEGIKVGQNLQVRLALSDESEAILIPRGGFYQTTGGNYIYVLSEDGKTAYKRDIRIGRQSDRNYEILEGLQPGEKVITSNYEVFNNADELILND